MHSHARRHNPSMQCSCDSMVRIHKLFMHKINRGSHANYYISRFLALECRRIITRSRFMKITSFCTYKDNVHGNFQFASNEIALHDTHVKTACGKIWKSENQFMRHFNQISGKYDTSTCVWRRCENRTKL